MFMLNGCYKKSTFITTWVETGGCLQASNYSITIQHEDMLLKLVSSNVQMYCANTNQNK